MTMHLLAKSEDALLRYSKVFMLRGRTDTQRPGAPENITSLTNRGRLERETETNWIILNHKLPVQEWIREDS